MNTTRKEFGTALAVLVRMCKAAESRGDLEGADLCARVVDRVLEAWPSEEEDDLSIPAQPEHIATYAWPVAERTLFGLEVASANNDVGRAAGRH